MREAGMSANVISFSAVISAYDKGGQWQQVALLHKMREAGMAANVIGFSSTISVLRIACPCVATHFTVDVAVTVHGHLCEQNQ